MGEWGSGGVGEWGSGGVGEWSFCPVGLDSRRFTRRLAACRLISLCCPKPERPFDRFGNSALYRVVVSEADLSLRRMDVDVDLVRRQLDEEEKRRLYVALPVWIRLAHGVGNRRRGRGPSVHEHVLLVPRRHREVRFFYVAPDAHGVCLRFGRRLKGNEAFDEFRAVDVEQPIGERSRGRKSVKLPPVDREREADAGMRERVDREYALYAAFLRCGRAQELAPRGNIAEEVAHLHERPRRAARRARLHELSRVDDDLSPLVGVVAPRHEGKARHRRD